MSASNWAICPQCLDRASADAEKERAGVMSLYGSIPVHEFDAKREALREVKPEDFRTFREDYEFYGAEEGRVVARYTGGCGRCGLCVQLGADKRFYTPTPQRNEQT
jgi:hypothetical protein